MIDLKNIEDNYRQMSLPELLSFAENSEELRLESVVLLYAELKSRGEKTPKNIGFSNACNFILKERKRGQSEKEIYKNLKHTYSFKNEEIKDIVNRLKTKGLKNHAFGFFLIFFAIIYIIIGFFIYLLDILIPIVLITIGIRYISLGRKQFKVYIEDKFMDENEFWETVFDD